jgi:hypothetical protein
MTVSLKTTKIILFIHYLLAEAETHKTAAVSKLTQEDMILTCIQEVTASNLGHDAIYLNGGFSLVGCLQSLHTNA